jgi:hypothetical protein
MILETLDGLIRAGIDALQTTCGLTVRQAHVSLVGNGSLTFPALGELRIRNGTLQTVHLGCDTALVGQLPERISGQKGRSGIEVLAGRVLASLLEDMEGRRPRGTVANLAVAPATLHTRGQRTFGVRLETDAGRLFLLAEVPSKFELESARNADVVAGLVAKYLPGDMLQRPSLQAGLAIDSFLVLIRKLEVDVCLELPEPDGTATLRGGFVLAHGPRGGQRALHLCADLADPAQATPAPGQLLRASVGLEDRSLDFTLEVLETGRQALAGGASLPTCWCLLPEVITIGQRRRSFRLPLVEPLAVELECAAGLHLGSPWGDGAGAARRVPGRVSDLSFEGARVVLPTDVESPVLEQGAQTRCHLSLPDDPAPLVISAVVRRVTLGLVDRNEWQREVGLEFVVAGDEDRDAVARLRTFVLALQRFRLANRIGLADARLA